MNLIRLGKVSSINYKNGTIKVTYADKNGAVTKEIPTLSFEYNMPEVGDLVFVVHLSNGTEAAFVAGTPFSEGRVPLSFGEGIYRKDFDKVGSAYIKYDSKNKKLEIMCPDGDITISANNINIEANKIDIKASSGSLIFNGIDITKHIHTDSVGGSTTGPQNGG